MSEAPAFIPGLELAEGFFQDALSPLLTGHLPELGYSAALIGPGSEVLGFDDRMSTDHHWGPRGMLFLHPADLHARGEEIRDVFRIHLPRSYRGYPTHWTEPDPNDQGTQHLRDAPTGPINHRVELLTLGGFFSGYLGITVDPPLAAADWLTLPCQKLRSIQAGRVFHDDLGLSAIRDRLAWYPHDVWLYMLASCWSRIGQDEHLMGRAGYAGDEIGSAVIASRLVRDAMRLAFLMERRYPPYHKWLGTAFRALSCADSILPILAEVMNASAWRSRDAALAGAYRCLAEMHNGLGVTPALPVEPASFWRRPFTVIRGDRFAAALRHAIQDETVSAIARRGLIGNLDLVSDNTDLLEDPARRDALRGLYA